LAAGDDKADRHEPWEAVRRDRRQHGRSCPLEERTLGGGQIASLAHLPMMHPADMQRRAGRATRFIVSLVAAAVLLGGCGEEAPGTPVIHDIKVPWQAAPILVEQDVYTTLEAACRRVEVVPGGTPLAVIDVRGGDSAVVVFADPNNQGECHLVRDPRGGFTMSIGGGMGGPGSVPPIAGRVITINTVEASSNVVGPQVDQPVTYLTGRAGADVHQVVVVLSDGRQVQTSLWDRGWFAAWWPGDDKRVQLVGYDVGGVRITAP
jgi:hypothetical protein